MPGEIYASGSTVAGNACVCGPQSPFGTQPINTLADLQHALSHVYMRFDTDPRSYSKKDYYYLLWVISRGLVHLYENEANPGQQGDVQEQLAALKKLATELGEKYNQMVPVVTQLEKDVESLKAANVSARVQENSDDIDVLEGNVLDIVDRVSRVEEQARLLEKAIEQLSQGGGSADDLKTIVAGLQSMVVTLDGRVKALEDEERHEHANADVLNGITAEKVAAWDSAEQNAKAYVDAEIAKIQMPSMEGYATEEWVQSQGYLTEHQDLGHLATKDEVLAVENKANANADALAVLNGDGEGSVVKTVNDAISNVIAGAPGTFDTLKEIADYIANDQTGAVELAEKVATLEEEVEDLKNSQPVIPDIPEQVVMTAGSGINIDSENTISAVITEDITVANTTIGSYSPGMVIEQGTDLMTVLKNLLSKIIDVVAVAPTVSLTGTPSTRNVEYGEEATTNFTVKLTQGYFKPASTEWSASNQPMNCSLTGVTSVPSLEWTVASSGMSATASDTKVITDVVKYNCTSAQINANTLTAVKSDGSASDVTYANTSLSVSNSITITPKYYAFIGGIDAETIEALSSDTVRSLPKYELSVTSSDKTLCSSNTSNNGLPILIACPAVYTLKQVESSLGTSDIDSYDVRGQVTVKCGTVDVIYNCYMCVVRGDKEFKNVQLIKTI